MGLRTNLAASRGLRPRVGVRPRLDLLTKKGAAKPRPYLSSVIRTLYSYFNTFPLLHRSSAPFCTFARSSHLSVLCTPYSVLCLHLSTFPPELRSDLHLRTLRASSAPLCTFAPFGSFPLYSILQPTIPHASSARALYSVLCTPYSIDTLSHTIAQTRCRSASSPPTRCRGGGESGRQVGQNSHRYVRG